MQWHAQILHNARPAISVVIPAYNRADSIRMAVESILRQTFTNFELLVVDDGSTDGTMAALDDVSDPRLHRLANPRNMGACAARNTGIHAAKGIWVAFQDSDDEWLPRKLEKQMARLVEAEPDAVACYCGILIQSDARAGSKGGHDGGAGRRTYPRYHPAPGISRTEGDLKQSILRYSLASTQTLIVRRDLLLELGGFDEAQHALQDWELAIRLSRRGRFAFVDEPLVLQYFSDNSITHNHRRRAEARLRVLDKHHALFAAHPKILARHHVSIAGELRRLGDSVGARRALGQALRIRPLDPLTLAKWLWLAMRSGLRHPPG